jgi:hypothetical protein
MWTNKTKLLSKKRVVLGVITLYVIMLVWGYARLPWAAVKNLRGYSSHVASASAVTFDPPSKLSPVQDWYLKQSIEESPVAVVPRISVDVKWNALALARVQSQYYLSGKGAEGTDNLYVCAFGAWIRVYGFDSWMA